MKRFALTLNLKNDPLIIEQYKEYHRNVWPEVIDSLKAIGITRLDIYLLGQRMFMHMETIDDFEARRDFSRYLLLDPRCLEWEELMGTFQEKVLEAGVDEKWALMEQVFKLEVCQ